MAIGPMIPDRPTPKKTPAKAPAKPNVQAAMAADKKATSKIIAEKPKSIKQQAAEAAANPGKFLDEAVAAGKLKAGVVPLTSLPSVASAVTGVAKAVQSMAGRSVSASQTRSAAETAKSLVTPKGAPQYASAPAAPKPAPAPAAPKPTTTPLGPSTPKPKEAPVTNPYGPTTPLQPKPSTPSRPSTPTPAAPKPGPKPTPTIPRPATTPAPSTPTGPTTKPMTPGTMPKPADTKPATSTLPSTGTSVPTSKRGNFLTGAGTVGDLATAADATVGTTPTTGVKRDVQMVMPPAAPPASRVTTQTSATTPRPSRTNVPKLPPIGTGAAELGAVQSNWQDYRR